MTFNNPYIFNSMYPTSAPFNNVLSPEWCFGSPSSKLSLREDVCSSVSSASTTPEIEEKQMFNGIDIFYSSHTTSPLIDPVVLNTCSAKHNTMEQSMMMPLLDHDHQKQLSHMAYNSSAPVSSDVYPFSNSAFSYIHQESFPTFYTNCTSTDMMTTPYNMIPHTTPVQVLPMSHMPAARPKPTVFKQSLGTQASPFTCSVPSCNKSFSRPYNLKSHMRTHTHERPYECQHKPCGWKFARPHDLKRHELQHTGQKPHSCRFCQKRFARSDALKRHWKVDISCAEALEEETRLNGGQQVKYPRRKRSKKEH